MIDGKKWVIIQPTHQDKRKLSKEDKWSNDSNNNLSRLFDAQLFHITNDDIDESAQIYKLINFDIELIEKEINFLKKVKSLGAKIIVSFSQDRRFILGKNLINSKGSLYTELCEIADGICSGVNPLLCHFGRYQNKIISMGEILENVNLSIPYENRNIDFMVSGEKNGDTLAFELELLMMIKEKYPDRILACCIPNEVAIKEQLIQKYSNILFPDSKVSFLDWLKSSKYYCNMEIRPRSGRCLIESYYCKVPFISSWSCYHSNLMNEYTYKTYDLSDILSNYERLTAEVPHSKQIKKMEQRAKYDEFSAVYDRIMKCLW